MIARLDVRAFLESAIEWSDEWDRCDDCARAFRTQPDSWDWRPIGITFEADRECLTLCRDCLQEYAESWRDDQIEIENEREQEAADILLGAD